MSDQETTFDLSTSYDYTAIPRAQFLWALDLAVKTMYAPVELGVKGAQFSGGVIAAGLIVQSESCVFGLECVRQFFMSKGARAIQGATYDAFGHAVISAAFPNHRKSAA